MMLDEVIVNLRWLRDQVDSGDGVYTLLDDALEQLMEMEGGSHGDY